MSPDGRKQSPICFTSQRNEIGGLFLIALDYTFHHFHIFRVATSLDDLAQTPGLRDLGGVRLNGPIPAFKVSVPSGEADLCNETEHAQRNSLIDWTGEEILQRSVEPRGPFRTEPAD